MTAYEPPGEAGTGAAVAHDAYGAPATYDAVVLAGGAARRLGGADKPGVRVGGRALLDRVLAACAGAATTVVVARPRATARPVVWAHEDPPGAGPVAALEAGLRHTTAEYVVVLSADLPFLDAATVRRLLAALSPDATRGATGPLPGTTAAASGAMGPALGTMAAATGPTDLAPGTASAAPGTTGPAPGTASAAPGTTGPAPGTASAAPGTTGPAPG
ncbi:NTP transferase domain-containing protein, partial [Streptomyces sp. NPDC058371]|uniref:molybdenum cofactor guanylyltransferase n=1 Tax=Streptomyces sp. NPDC058371 TaxID=3346463 RepID=UPI0036475D6C